MGHVEVAHVAYWLPDGTPLLYEVGFRVGDGARVALIGANGSGKTTLLRLIAGDLEPHEGVVTHSGGLGVMRQFIGSARSSATVRSFLADLAPERVRDAAHAVAEHERRAAASSDTDVQLAYAQSLSDWSDAGGWEAEVLWETCCREALGLGYDEARERPVSTLSGGEQKRLALEALMRGTHEVLLLDEPDNYLDVPGKRWLEETLKATEKTILYVSHDREVIAATAQRIVTVESRTAWTHGAGFATYHAARRDRIARFEELRRRWDEEREKLKELVRMLQRAAQLNSGMASRYQAAQTRLRKFEEAGPPPEPPRDQRIAMRLRGGRTGVRALSCAGLELTGLVKPFDLEVFFGERVGVLGANGTGKSHFLRLLAGEAIAHEGSFRLGARVVPGFFAQTHHLPDVEGRTPLEVLRASGFDRQAAMNSLTRYGLNGQYGQRFETLSGGQQARLQILLLESGGTTLLLLDEPTDNLDLESAEALEQALDSFEGTVLAVTHDRWFARGFDRFCVFGSDGTVFEASEPVWDERRPPRGKRAKARG